VSFPDRESCLYGAEGLFSLPSNDGFPQEGQAFLSRTRMIGFLVCWLIGLAFAAVSSTHALNYIGHPRSYFFFDTLLPVALILGLLVATLRQMR
jgi:hypothetical protein